MVSVLHDERAAPRGDGDSQEVMKLPLNRYLREGETKPAEYLYLS